MKKQSSWLKNSPTCTLWVTSLDPPVLDEKMLKPVGFGGWAATPQNSNLFGYPSLKQISLDYMTKVNNLKATPPKSIAKAISNTVMNSAFFQPKSLHSAAMVAMQGM